MRGGQPLPEAGFATSHSEGTIVIPLVHWLGERENRARAPPSRVRRAPGGYLWAWNVEVTLSEELLG